MIIYPQKLEEMVLFFEVSALGVTIALVIVLVRMKVNLGIVMLVLPLLWHCLANYYRLS